MRTRVGSPRPRKYLATMVHVGLGVGGPAVGRSVAVNSAGPTRRRARWRTHARSVGAVAALVVARLRGQPVSAVLVACGVAASAAMLVGIVALAVLSRDAAMDRALRQLPAERRAARATVDRTLANPGEYARIDQEVTATLPREGFGTRVARGVLANGVRAANRIADRTLALRDGRVVAERAPPNADELLVVDPAGLVRLDPHHREAAGITTRARVSASVTGLALRGEATRPPTILPCGPAAPPRPRRPACLQTRSPHNSSPPSTSTASTVTRFRPSARSPTPSLPVGGCTSSADPRDRARRRCCSSSPAWSDPPTAAC